MRGERWCAWFLAAALAFGIAGAARAQDPDEAGRLDEEAVQLYKQGKYDEALPRAERLLALREKAFGRENIEVISALNLLSAILLGKGDYARALEVSQRDLEITARAYGPLHPEVAKVLDNIAVLYRRQGNYARAEALYQQSLSIEESAFGPSHVNVAPTLNNLALLYETTGEYARAETLYRRALSIQEQAFGPDDLRVATAVANLARLLTIARDLGQAEPLCRRALAIRERVLGKDHPDVASSLTSLATLNVVRGDYPQAEDNHLRALRIRERALGPEHPDVASSLNDLGILYKTMGNAARAEPLLTRALAIQDKTLGKDHPSLIVVLNNLAWVYEGRGEYGRAEPLYHRALAIAERALGPDHPDLGASLSNLALLYTEEGRYSQAEPLLLRALGVIERALGKDHPDLARVLDNQALLYVVQHRVPEAREALARSIDIEDKSAALLLAMGSERQKRAFMATLSANTARAISLHIDVAPSDPGASRLALTTLLQRKGRVIDAMADSLAVLRRHLTAEDQRLFDRLAVVKSELGADIFRGPSGRSAEQYQKTLARLEETREKLDREIGQRSAAVRAELATVTLEQVMEAIPEGAALVEIARHTPNLADKGPARYVAYVLRRRGAPSFAVLGPAAPIDAAIGKLRAALADFDRTHDPRPAARALDALVMQPLRAQLGETRWVLLSPDAALNLVPFEALVDEEGRYLVERYAFTYLTSGRDLLRLAARAEPREGSAVFADPAYGTLHPAAPDDGRRGLRALDLSRARFLQLPDTATEARAVARSLPDARVLLGAEATEAAIKALHAPRILHLATHGFFLPVEVEAPAGVALTPQDIAAAAQRENPLLRAGLALAGANARESGDRDDGILTALEVSGLDLYGTRLVVLSACETGLGEAVSGEGVYGLRRALVMAGAETQVMSLWEVDSGATRQLMTAYYEELKAGAGRGEALRRVQRAMLARKETAHPNLWASFIVSGDFRALDGAVVVPDLTVHPGARGCACMQASEGAAAPGPAAALAGLALLTLRRSRRRSYKGPSVRPWTNCRT